MSAPRKTIRRAKKFKKDPHAPKKPQTAYFLFMADVRKETREENPELKIAGLGRLMGQKWKALTLEQKQPYVDDALIAKGKYQILKTKYDQSSAKVDYDREKAAWMKKNKPKFKPDPNAPKKPQTAYFIFMAQVRRQVKADNPDASVSQLGKLMGLKWKALTVDEKKPFQDAAVKARAAYNTRKAEYEESDDKAEYDERKADFLAEQTRAEEKVTKKPKQRKRQPKKVIVQQIDDSSEEDVDDDGESEGSYESESEGSIGESDDEE